MARRTHIYALLFCLSGLAYTAQAQKPYRLPDSKVGSTIHKLADSAHDYNNALYRGLKKSEFFGNGGRGERILQDANEFQASTFRLKERFDKDRYGDERALSDDVRLVLRKATIVNRFMVINFGRTGADDRWAVVKQNLELLAQSYNVVWVGYGISNRPRRMDDEDAKELLAEIKSKSELFRKGMESFLKVERSIDPYTRNDINDEVKNFIGLVSHLKVRVDDRDGGTPVFNELMRSEAKINKFIADKRYRLQPQIREDWRTIHSDLVELARGYKVYPRAYEYY
ncbi:MAG: hypothetical protein J2P31_11185 [Blastocatellia bacterium]|nr:hypothetical protein [Blastocatellia bacterium]